MAGFPTVDAKNGFKMPCIGLGTWQTSESEIETALEAAFDAGYRLIDTAYVYLNQEAIGRVLQKWFKAGKVKREELFIVSKLPNIGMYSDQVEKFLNLTLEHLQLSYLDLYLVHCPWGFTYFDDNMIFPFKSDGKCDIDPTTDIAAVWKKMEQQVRAGRTRNIGVSNFSAQQVGRILEIAEIPPATNQIQLNAYLQQPSLVRYLQEKDIVVTAYSPLGSPACDALYKAFGVEKDVPKIMEDQIVREVADEIGKTPAQVLLRHIMQKNIVVIPKSSNPKRIQENIQIFDFELNAEQMKKLDEMDQEFPILNLKEILNG